MSCDVLSVLLLLLRTTVCSTALDYSDDTPILGVAERAELYAARHPPDTVTPPVESGGFLEGDIKLVPGQEWPPSKVNPYNAVWDKTLLWTDNVLYYTLEEGVYDPEQIQEIETGIEDLLNSTMVDGQLCVDIRKREEADNPDDITNYVMVGKYGGCSSYVGMRGGMQTLSLEDYCIERYGTIMHEFLHAFGFYHEHQREDRDDYVTINWENIQPEYWYAFQKYEEGVTIDHLGTHYDYESIMHYNAYHFAVNESIPTIIPTDPDAEIGQRTHEDAGCLLESAYRL